MAAGPHSLRELDWMAEAVQFEKWNHTATLIATIENSAFGKRGRRTRPQDRHPLIRQAPKRKRLSKQALDRMVGL